MNRGVLQNSPVQQMMAAGNPSWWNINNLLKPPLNNNNINNNNNNNNLIQPHQYNMNLSTIPSSAWLDDHDHPNHHHQEEQQQFPESLSQLLLSGVFMGEEAKKMESWEEQAVAVLQQHHHQQQTPHPLVLDVKQESSVNSYNNNNNNNNVVYNHTHHGNEQEFQELAAKTNCWSHHHQLNIPVSSPQSCVTTNFSSSNNMLDFSSSMSSSDNLHSRHPPLVSDRSPECNSTSTGGALKKAKVQPSSTQSTFKVRKEKLGDRITALHQLVSPFGKTDTASVLLEAIGYIRFLQSQIEALSLPYLSSGAGNNRQPHSVQGERKCMFPEDPGQLLNDNCLKRKGSPDQDSYEEPKKDLKSRGLCLIPVSCTQHVGSENGADYWAPALGGGGFR